MNTTQDIRELKTHDLEVKLGKIVKALQEGAGDDQTRSDLADREVQIENELDKRQRAARAKGIPADLPTMLHDFDVDDDGEIINEVRVSTPAFITEDGHLAVTTETTVITGSYYGEFYDGKMVVEDGWIAESLVEWAEKNGGHWEWYNPAYFVFYKD